VLATLYLTFAYLVYAIVVLLVVGHRHMGPFEWTGLAGGPVIIYSTRVLISSYYNFRIENLASRLKEQQEERSKTIQKLKDATRYDSTLELIEKYGGGEGKSAKGKPKGTAQADEARRDASDQGNKGQKPQQQQSYTPGRTNMPPPPTANIQRRPDQQQALARAMEPTAEFAPNAEFAHSTEPPRGAHSAHPSSQSPQQQPESRWYDRLFDVILGEDETAPKNRIVLLCATCRLVNGQAPPGIKSTSEIGKWRCMNCGAENGEEEDEGKRIVREVLGSTHSTIEDRAEEVHDEHATGDDELLVASSDEKQKGK
jgi:hypothetical protein